MKFNVVLICLFHVAFLFPQSDPIKTYSGIPIITYGQDIKQDYSSDYDFTKIDSAGILALQVADFTKAAYDKHLSGKHFKIIPELSDTPAVTNQIMYYTKARYTEWKVVGSDKSNGQATLYYNTNCAFDGSVVSTINSLTLPNTLMISGPSYTQEVRHSWLDHDPVAYRASFHLKREYLSNQHPAPIDTICILRVTTSKIIVDCTPPWDPKNGCWRKVWTYPIDTLIIYDSSLAGNNTWIYKDLNYGLNSLPDSVYPDFTNGITQKRTVSYVEFQVIWKGDASNVRLSFDKVILSDYRGREILDPVYQNKILSQVKNVKKIMDPDRVAGWLAVDEPQSIDEYEPIKIINDLLNSPANLSGNKLWVAFGGGWNGRYGNATNPFPTVDHLIGIDEFMRHVKNANAWVNFYLYDDPFTQKYPPTFPDTDNYKLKNISTAGDSLYTRFNNASKLPGCSLFWGASIQTGKYYDRPDFGGRVNYREISGTEMLYQTNLALLSGAKVISPWMYFGYHIGSDYVYTGLANKDDNGKWDYDSNEKYLTLKNLIAPRLSGLFGKTLKMLIPTTQYIGSKGINFTKSANNNPEPKIPIDKDCLDYITPRGSVNPLDYHIDYGFFTDSTISANRKYFMIINRYDSNVSDHEIGLKSLNRFTDWKLFNYSDSVTTIIHSVDGRAHFSDTIRVGDASLYSLTPVVK